MHGCMVSRFSHVQLFATSWTVAHQAPLSMWFSSQEYWSEFPLESVTRGIFPTQWSNSRLLWLLHCRQILYCWATREAPLPSLPCFKVSHGSLLPTVQRARNWAQCSGSFLSGLNLKCRDSLFNSNSLLPLLYVELQFCLRQKCAHLKCIITNLPCNWWSMRLFIFIIIICCFFFHEHSIYTFTIKTRPRFLKGDKTKC